MIVTESLVIWAGRTFAGQRLGGQYRHQRRAAGDERRRAIQMNPPDILLTNFVMLELVLTRRATTTAAEVVGLQWQFTGTQLDPDASAGCPIDVTITGIKFLP